MEKVRLLTGTNFHKTPFSQLEGDTVDATGNKTLTKGTISSQPLLAGDIFKLWISDNKRNIPDVKPMDLIPLKVLISQTEGALYKVYVF